jgi:23S rRNA (pseudouridine1915-N3)-methyltransferase
MQIDLIYVGKKTPRWVLDGFNEYVKRLPSNCTLNPIEIALCKRTKNADLKRLQQQEGEQMLAAIASNAHIIALDERGVHWDTMQLANQLAQWMQDHSRLALLVGGPEGLAPVCLQCAHQHWSLSSLTFPHTLVRIVIAEQVYRAWSILNNHPYHRE